MNIENVINPNNHQKPGGGILFSIFERFDFKFRPIFDRQPTTSLHMHKPQKKLFVWGNMSKKIRVGRSALFFIFFLTKVAKIGVKMQYLEKNDEKRLFSEKKQNKKARVGPIY